MKLLNLIILLLIIIFTFFLFFYKKILVLILIFKFLKILLNLFNYLIQKLFNKNKLEYTNIEINTSNIINNKTNYSIYNSIINELNCKNIFTFICVILSYCYIPNMNYTDEFHKKNFFDDSKDGI